MRTSRSIGQLYIFGDSLSDVGNIYRVTRGLYPASPPYFQGRYSNGQVWVEYLAFQLGLTAAQSRNLACGGATTGKNSSLGVPGLLMQAEGFLATQPRLAPNALCVLWAGANDYLHEMTSPTTAVNNIAQTIAMLTKAGATQFLVANLPDLGQLPATHHRPNSQYLSTLTQTHNATLSQTLNRSSNPQVQITEFDVSALYRDAIAHPQRYGLTDVTGACLTDTQAYGNADQFLFWDGIHPTTAAHRILANRAMTALNQQSIAPIQSL
ncbi:MAG TPA: SGNH/GDSL hydrolase family protein [Trichocoleus sp.]|jgi:phospholipase/lecithinase/hemolysin